MIDLSIRLPLPSFTLQVSVQLTGGCIALMGPSGSGKTSLLESIAGLKPHARGKIRIGEQTVLDSDHGVNLPPERRRVGYVPQDSLLFPHLNVAGNLAFGLPHATPGHLAEIVALLELQGLLDQPAPSISGGERQRVALARALAIKPALLLLDEPFAALDFELKERILPYLLRIREEAGIPILYVTHHPGEARVLADELVRLEHGRVVAQGLCAELLDQSKEVASGWDNILAGTLEGGDPSWTLRVRALGLSIAETAPRARAGDRAVYRVAADDVLISTQKPDHLSARNLVEAEIQAIDIQEREAFVRLLASGVPWRATLTQAAAQELQLRVGNRVYLAIKAHALRRL